MEYKSELETYKPEIEPELTQPEIEPKLATVKTIAPKVSQIHEKIGSTINHKNKL